VIPPARKKEKGKLPRRTMGKGVKTKAKTKPKPKPMKV